MILGPLELWLFKNQRKTSVAIGKSAAKPSESPSDHPGTLIMPITPIAEKSTCLKLLKSCNYPKYKKNVGEWNPLPPSSGPN